MQAKRPQCTKCHYPLITCICDQIEKVSVPKRIIVLQHKLEAGHAKNTLRLLKLISPSVEVIKTKKTSQLEALDLQLEKTALVYPSDISVGIEDLKLDPKAEVIENLIFIDASWRQAYGIWQVNKWLHQYKQLHFNVPPPSRYSIRISRKDYQLSTLEAVAYSLNVLSGTPMGPFHKALDALQGQWTKFAKNKF